MKVRNILILLSTMVSVLSCQQEKAEKDPGKEIGALHLSKQKPQPGDTLLISFRHDAGDNEKIQGFYYYLVGTNVYPEDLELIDSAGIWRGQLVIPDSAQVVAFNFQQNYRNLNNSGKGFVQHLYNENGNILPGTRAASGYFYQNYGGQYEIKNDSTLEMVEEDLQQNPELENSWDDFYGHLLYSSDKDKGEKYIQKRLQFYSTKASLTEKNFITLSNFYELLKDKESGDSINKLASEKFPGGDIAESQMFNKFYSTENYAEKEKIFEHFQQIFGNSSGYKRSYMLNILASHYAENGNWEKFGQYSGMVSNKNEKASNFNNLAWKMAQSGENLQKAEEISKTSLQLLKETTDDEKPDYWTRNQYRESQTYSKRMYLDTYAYILNKRGKLKEAIEQQKEAIADGKNSEYNERYIQYLITDKNYAEVIDNAENFIRNNTATTGTKEFYKEAFLKTDRDKDVLNKRLAQLETEGRNKAMEDLKKEMLNEEAPLFDLVDLQGDKVSLASLKGKTVILDFWATWCGPCTASFPGMQMAVDNFKDDKNVEFLFVNTMEDGPTRKEDVAGFIKNNNYSFHVVMDQPEFENSRTFKTAADYNVSGIPTKIIIGPEGKMNFKKVGYGGNNEKMVQELELMIELLNSNEKVIKKETVS